MTKKTYLCIQRSPKTDKPQPPSPSQMEEMFAKFHAWKEKFADKIVDMGGKLGDGRVVSANDTTDGPFIETKEIVGGYMIVQADSMEEAAIVARESPGTMMPGSSVEVREIVTS